MHRRLKVPPPPWQARVWYCDAEHIVHDAHWRLLVSTPPAWQAEVWYCDAVHAVHDGHVDEYLPPAELQRCCPNPARTHVHPVGWCV